MDASLHDRLLEFLRSEGVAFRLVQHAPTLTSADSARERGEPLGSGAKALLVKGDDIFRLLVLPADQRLDSRRAKENLGVKDLRFATAEELEAIAGVPSGAVPPFGAPLLPVPLFADPAVGQTFPNVAFNAGSRTSSIIMAAADWEHVARPARVVLVG